MNKEAIEGLVISPLEKITDHRGSVMHMLRRDSAQFKDFGEVYFSTVKHGVVKAWKRHHVMVQNFAVPVGKIKLLVYDARENSSSCGVVNEISLGCDHYCLVTIPAMLWYGFQGLSSEDALVANCASIPHDPKECDKLPAQDSTIPYKWAI